jgi:transketolase
MLRTIPNMTVLRPGDATETIEAWRVAIEHRTGPVMLVLSRQKLPIFDRSKLGAAEGVRRGGYVLWEPPGGPEAILIATGSEVPVALTAAEKLLADGIRARVVSLPSWELFEAQPADYRESVLPRAIRARVGIEAGSAFGWLKYVTEDGVMLGMSGFGASAPGERLFQEFNFTPERAMGAIRHVLQRSKA